MAKTKISEFSATPANNTDIDSINIAEGCAPSGINDAIRELMSQLKDFQTGAVGDSFNGPVGSSTAAAGAFTTLSASSTLGVTGVATLGAGAILNTPASVTLTNATGLPLTTGTTGTLATTKGGTGLTSFTSGGVVYASSTSALATGSALTFDGTTFGVNAGASIGSSTAKTKFYSDSTYNGIFNGASLGLNEAIYMGGGSQFFYTGGVETFRTTSTSLYTASGINAGFGISAPVAPVTANRGNVSGAGQWASSAIAIANPTNTGSYSQISFGYTVGTTNASAYMGFVSTNQGTNGYGDLVFGTRAVNTDTQPTERLRLDSAGNFGIGTNSPSSYGALGVGRAVTIGSVNVSAAFSDAVFNTLRITHASGSLGLNFDDNNLIFQSGGTSPTTRMTLNSSGNLTISGNVGINTTPTTSGTGITFPATQSASSDANTLDDYEEGTFTPTVSGSTTAGTGTYTARNGSYTKIGNVVHFLIDYILSAHTGTGDILITGLPFTAGVSYYPDIVASVQNLSLTALHYIGGSIIAPNGTTLYLNQTPVGGGSAIGIPIDGASDVRLSGFYFV
jgi:hypothetical protein